MGGVVGGVVGFYGGALLGGWISEERCQCGEPLPGLGYGMVIGGTAGAIAGYRAVLIPPVVC